MCATVYTTYRNKHYQIHYYPGKPDKMVQTRNMANTQEESSSDLEMETSPRCIEYPVENDREEAEAPALNTVALIPTNNSDREPVDFASYDTAFEALCT